MDALGEASFPLQGLKIFSDILNGLNATLTEYNGQLSINISGHWNKII